MSTVLPWLRRHVYIAAVILVSAALLGVSVATDAGAPRSDAADVDAGAVIAPTSPVLLREDEDITPKFGQVIRYSTGEVGRTPRLTAYPSSSGAIRMVQSRAVT